MFPFAEREQANIFEFQAKGLEFYERFFGYPYPFGKIDSVFCPDFAYSAMEYPGAVTYSEVLLPARTNNSIDIGRRGHVFLHELSHMWFGNMVTMKWWNNLWLNESFAEFICHQAWADIFPTLESPSTDPWPTFLAGKFRGYREDSLDSTHPIAGDVENTEIAASIFDGITYNKGSSVMKQLLCIIGEETFSAAIKNYFTKYAFKNTTLEDLLAEFDEELKKKPNNTLEMSLWKDDWIKSSGLNILTFEKDAESGKGVITQTAQSSKRPTLRNHFIKVGFFGEKGKLLGVKELTTSKTGKDEIDLEGVSDYKAVILNYDDLTFARVIVDEVSLAYFIENYALIESPLARLLIVRCAYDNFHNELTSIEVFSKLAIAVFEHEHSVIVVYLVYCLQPHL